MCPACLANFVLIAVGAASASSISSLAILKIFSNKPKKKNGP